MQWSELQGFINKNAHGKAEIHHTTVFKRFSLWTAFNVFDKSHQAILSTVHDAGHLDLSVLTLLRLLRN